jgi:hypothetical protein
LHRLEHRSEPLLHGLHPHPTALNGSGSRKALAFQF